MPKPNDASPKPAEQCPPCLPFCGLDQNLGLAERLRQCGGFLLEQGSEEPMPASAPGGAA